MKRYLTCLLCMTTTFLSAQSFTVAADKMNIAYIGVDNPLTIVADNTPCNNLTATTDNGTIEKNDGCHFNYRPVKEKITIIEIRRGSGGIIAKKEIRSKIIPDPIVKVGNKSGGPISLAVFKVQPGLLAAFDAPFELDLKFSVVSFRIAILDKGQAVFGDDIIENSFSPATISAFNKMKVGDRVLIDNIKVKGPDHTIRTIGDMMFFMR